MPKRKVKIEKKIMKVPYCSCILRNMMTDESGATFLYDGVRLDIKPGEEIELKKEICDHLQNLMIRKSRFEHKDGNSVKIYFEEPRFLMQILKEYEKEEEVTTRKVMP